MKVFRNGKPGALPAGPGDRVKSTFKVSGSRRVRFSSKPRACFRSPEGKPFPPGTLWAFYTGPEGNLEWFYENSQWNLWQGPARKDSLGPLLIVKQTFSKYLVNAILGPGEGVS